MYSSAACSSDGLDLNCENLVSPVVDGNPGPIKIVSHKLLYNF